jgi:hypothetical protein
MDDSPKTDSTSSRKRHLRQRKYGMWWTVGKSILKSYGLLWMTAVGGIIGANLSATIGTLFFVAERKDIYVQPWAHTGWYIGIAVFFLGAIAGKLRFINGTALGGGLERPGDASADAEAVEAKTETPAEPNEQSSALSFVFTCGLAGGFLGLLLGGSLLVFPMSYAYSPFAAPEAVASIKVVQEQPARSAQRRPVIQSSHPVTLYLCLTPVILGAIAGMAGGGVVVVKYGGGESQ